MFSSRRPFPSRAFVFTKITVSTCIVEQIIQGSMDKAAIKLHKMNIFPKVPPLYTHLPSTFLPVFSGTMLPNGLPVSCLPPPDSIPPIVGATTRHPHAYLIFIYVIKRSAVSYVCLLLAAFPVCRGAHRSPARLGCHLHMPRPKKGRSMTAPTNPMSKNTGAPVEAPVFFGAANGIRVSRELRARSSAALTAHRAVIHYRSPPNPMSRKGGMPMRGIPPFWSC